MTATAGERPIAICVLGPGRTGTSLTIRLLGLAGVFLGEDRELLSRPGIPANPKGFWEHRRLARLNQRILHRLGGSWSEPPPLPPGWEGSERLAGEREDARALLDRTFGDRPHWGWKDSRCSLTLPFWQRLLPDDRYDTRYVVCLRNPVDVAASLKPPQPLSGEQKLALWTTYLASALVHTSGRRRLLLPYEEYFRDWQGTIARLLRFGGCEVPPAGSEAAQRMREFADPGLWRHRTDREAAMRDHALPERVRSLYGSAERLAAADPDPVLAEATDALARRLLEEGVER